MTLAATEREAELNRKAREAWGDAQPNRALQDALDFACRLGRYQGGHEVRALVYRDGNGETRRMLVNINRSRPFARPLPVKVHNHDENCLRLNGDGLRGLKRDAVALALKHTDGNATKAAGILGIGRTYVYQVARKAGLAVILALAVTGCTTARRKPADLSELMREMVEDKPPVTATQQAAAQTPPAVIVSWTTPDTDPAIVFEVWQSEDLATWTLIQEVPVKQATIPNDRPRAFFKVRARDTETGQVSSWATTNEVQTNGQNE